MIFADLPLDEAEGAVLAYAVTAGALVLRKGTVLNSDYCAALQQAGLTSVLAARFEPGDIGEDEAAQAIGATLASCTIRTGAATTGRINLFASEDGVFCVDASRIDAVNAHDARISLATIRNHMRVEAGQMVATVKIIPFALPKSLIDDICPLLLGNRAMEVKAFRPLRIGLIQSRLPSIRETVLDKTRELMEKRAARNGGTLVAEKRVIHETEALGSAIADLSNSCDILVIFSASAVADATDIVPRSILRSGGQILRVGMPVDPGNLLVLGKRDEKYIVAAPGSARSMRENSLDWVLDRLMAGMDLSSTDLSRMGVGGLLL
ncbi:molybdopterin biosynthesis enzyme [Ochrobactrum sp. 19YEA23]|uniref:molybdopterin-binding protein n=1 Tax=Ochrobactrum sp. 19YEA23 TaxID=3039854 RepID=UPI0024788CAA|nr:molybdopterin biosynthesis enzyme [Ochrobactrum sp. 19YEA23]